MFSYHKEDFIIRQIQSAARALAKLFFNSETVSYTIKDESNYTQRFNLFKNQRTNGAT